MFPIRGVQWWDVWTGNAFNSPIGIQSLQELKDSIPHCNYVYLDAKNNLDVGSSTVSLGDMTSVIAGITEARKLGYQIVVRGGIRNLSETLYTPTDKEQFFNTFGDCHKEWAKVMQQYGVEAYGIGVELELLEDNTNSAYWNSMINKVRSVYSGKVWYATNHWDSKEKGDKKRAAQWMNNLDYICISFYPILIKPSDFTGSPPKYVYPNTPSVADLLTGLHSFPTWGTGAKSFAGTDLTKEYETLGIAHGKKILFHMGLASCWGMAASPWRSPATGQPDAQGQANWMQAFFEGFGSMGWVDGWLLDGAWLTALKETVNPATNIEFRLQNKPATQTVENAFATLSPGVVPGGLTAGLAVLGTLTVLGLCAWALTRKKR